MASRPTTELTTEPENIWKPFRPRLLARYMASSARLSSSSYESPWSGAMAMPMDAEVATSSPNTMNGWLIASSERWASWSIDS